MRKGVLLSLIILWAGASWGWGFDGDMGVDTEPLTDGSADYPWLIEDISDFDEFAGDPVYWGAGVCTRLECNIDLAGRVYDGAVIGSYVNKFYGVFDGNDHVVANMCIGTVDEDLYGGGLFYDIVNEAEVRGLGVVNINIMGNNLHICGGLCANSSGKIVNCYTTGFIIGISRLDIVGGLCSYCEGVCMNCYSTCDVIGGDGCRSVGGLCGEAREGVPDSGTFTECYTDGLVECGKNSLEIGGLCGVVDMCGDFLIVFADCYSTSTVSAGAGSRGIGGLCGWNWCGTITDCYMAGTVSATSDSDGGVTERIGGLCGHNHGGTIEYCHMAGMVSVTNNGERSVAIGGLCGYNDVGRIIHCHAAGTVSVDGEEASYAVGGLCGGNENSEILYCGSTASVNCGNGGWRIGGLCGWSYSSSITESFAKSSITVSDIMSLWVGGICGDANCSEIRNCYSDSIFYVDIACGVGGICGNFDGGVLENCYSAGIEIYEEPDSNVMYTAYPSVEGTNCFWDVGIDGEVIESGGSWGLPTDQMQMKITYVDAGWDFTDVDGDPAKWVLREGGFPRLNWEDVELSPKYSGGYGTADSPYQIATKQDLLDMAANVEDYGQRFVLTADIDLAGEVFSTAVIAADTDNTNDDEDFDGYEFKGVFDGGGYAIRNLTIDTGGAGNDFLGLFGKLGGRYVKLLNLRVIDGNISSGDYCFGVGLLFGSYGEWYTGYSEYRDKLIENCFSSGGIVCRDWAFGVGGVGGYCRNDEMPILITISNCGSSCSVIVGENSDSSGGILGFGEGFNISSCYAVGSVTSGYGSDYTGGLCGECGLSSIGNCYASGLVSGGDEVGGLAGFAGDCHNCFWDVESSGIADPEAGGADSDGMVGLSTAQMQVEGTFTAAGWDFNAEGENGLDDIWHMPYGGSGYPRLWFERDIPGDFVGGYGVDIEDLAGVAAGWGDVYGMADLVVIAEYWLEGCVSH